NATDGSDDIFLSCTYPNGPASGPALRATQAASECAGIIGPAGAVCRTGLDDSAYADPTDAVLSAPRAPCAPSSVHLRSHASRRRVLRHRARSVLAPNHGPFQSEYGTWPRFAVVRASARGG